MFAIDPTLVTYGVPVVMALVGYALRHFDPLGLHTAVATPASPAPASGSTAVATKPAATAPVSPEAALKQSLLDFIDHVDNTETIKKVEAYVAGIADQVKSQVTTVTAK